MPYRYSNIFQAIILAAGSGKRMGSNLPKVLTPLYGKPVISHITGILSRLGFLETIIIVGKNSNEIQEYLGKGFRYVIQPIPLGSGDAVKYALKSGIKEENTLIMCGDSPLFFSYTINNMINTHCEKNAAVSLVSSILNNPSGYGRIIRDKDDNIQGITEEIQASEKQKSIREVNGGCYAFNTNWLNDNIYHMKANESGEYCLTEMVEIAICQKKIVNSISAEPEEVAGINTLEQLNVAEEIIRQRSIDPLCRREDPQDIS